METRHSAKQYFVSSRSRSTSLVISARKRPAIMLSVLRKISRRRDWPHGLYLRLKRSNRWKVLVACMSSVSTDRS